MWVQCTCKSNNKIVLQIIATKCMTSYYICNESKNHQGLSNQLPACLLKGYDMSSKEQNAALTQTVRHVAYVYLNLPSKCKPPFRQSHLKVTDVYG